MVRLSLSKLSAAAGSLALLLTAETGVASADPDLSPAINTTCNYSQVMSALNAQSPVAAAQLNGSPTAQAALRGFLDSTPDQRRQIAQELESRPDSAQYVQQFAGLVVQVANTCNNY
jgi:hemophore-related protein